MAVVFQRQRAGTGDTEGLSRSPRQTVLSRMQSGSAVVAIPIQPRNRDRRSRRCRFSVKTQSGVPRDPLVRATAAGRWLKNNLQYAAIRHRSRDHVTAFAGRIKAVRLRRVVILAKNIEAGSCRAGSRMTRTWRRLSTIS